MKNLNTFILCLIFTFSASVQADTADCSGGRCPALDHVKDVGGKIAKDLVPFAVAAIVISVQVQLSLIHISEPTRRS